MPAESISTERSRLGTWASHLVLDFFVGRSHRFLLTITYSNHLKALVNTRFDAFQPCDLLVADGRTQQILLRLSQQRCMLKDHEKTGGFCFWKYVLEISKKLGDKMNTRYLCMYIYIWGGIESYTWIIYQHLGHYILPPTVLPAEFLLQHLELLWHSSPIPLSFRQFPGGDCTKMTEKNCETLLIQSIVKSAFIWILQFTKLKNIRFFWEIPVQISLLHHLRSQPCHHVIHPNRCMPASPIFPS